MPLLWELGLLFQVFATICAYERCGRELGWLRDARRGWDERIVKYAFLFALALLAPLLGFSLKATPRLLPAACFVLGLSTLLVGPILWAAPVPWPTWPGPVRGIIVSFVDAFSLAFIWSTRPARIPSSLIIAFSIFCLALVISTFGAFQWEPAIFYAWQLLRTVILFVAIARVGTTDRTALISLVAGLGVGLILEAAYVAYQYKTGVARPGGTFGHSNFMGLAIDFVVFPAVSLMLGSRRLLWPAATALAGLTVALLGGSRATVGLCVVGILLTGVLSIVQKPTSRKFGFTGALALLLLASAPAIIWAANRRSGEVLASSDAERKAMKEAAAMIIADHPFGVGANQYVLVANLGGYSQRAGVAWNEDNRAAPVHDTYYLITAEMGFLGLIGFLAMLGSLIVLGFKKIRRKSGDTIAALVPGLLATIIVSSVHIGYEFVFMDFTIHYLLAMAAGMLVAIASLSTGPAKKPARVPMASAAVPRLS